jgi:hypothetical protein
MPRNLNHWNCRQWHYLMRHWSDEEFSWRRRNCGTRAPMENKLVEERHRVVAGMFAWWWSWRLLAAVKRGRSCATPARCRRLRSPVLEMETTGKKGWVEGDREKQKIGRRTRSRTDYCRHQKARLAASVRSLSGKRRRLRLFWYQAKNLDEWRAVRWCT